MPHLSCHAFHALPLQVQYMLRNSNLMSSWRNTTDRLSRSAQQLLTNHEYVPTFVFWLYFGYRPVPRSSHNLLRYVVFLVRTIAASSIACYLNVVCILHQQCGFPNPLQDPLFKFQKELLVRGIKCLHSKVVQQKLPITPDILHKLHGQLDLTNAVFRLEHATEVGKYFARVNAKWYPGKHHSRQ